MLCNLTVNWVNIIRIDFSDPQSGKGTANRLAATCKAHVRKYINEGHDIETADQLKETLTSYGGVAGSESFSYGEINETLENTQKTLGISKLHNFAFDKNSVKAWRAYAIGDGKVIQIEKSGKGI